MNFGHLRTFAAIVDAGGVHRAAAAIALAGSGYGIAIVPSTVQIPHEYVHAAALMRRGAVLGGWLRVAWDSQRFLASYAQR
jgi:DNA-binding transcriptional LysR family regulator